jgi:hypothetical protein
MRQRIPRPFLVLAGLIAAAGVLAAGAERQRARAWLGPAEPVAPGVAKYLVTDAALVDGQGPIRAYLLELDLDRVELRSVLSNDRVLDAERVDAMAARHQAVAAVNAGFFVVRTGEPAGVLKVSGELVSDGALTRGALAIGRPGRRPQRLDFDQIAARVRLRVTTREGDVLLPVDGVDTTRERGKLMVYTPSYHTDSDTAANGLEWALDGTTGGADRYLVRDIRRDRGRTPIPAGGAVLSYGGLDPPAPLAGLAVGSRVGIETVWTTVHGTPARRLDEAWHIVNGAGLLMRAGRAVSNWVAVEKVNGASFVETRHPRTLIGVDRRGAVWLVAIDGRQPTRSIGMTFADLVRLAGRLELRDALNLDGGGSTTMVVRGETVNTPSDAVGARPVSDAILVVARPPSGSAFNSSARE